MQGSMQLFFIQYIDKQSVASKYFSVYKKEVG